MAENHLMVRYETQMKNSKKPIVALVRGKAVGISFTTTAFFDFIYCTPEAEFFVPFMKSFQSPEGASTYTFVKQFGYRRANELLLLDKPVTAKEALHCGYVN